MGGGGGEREGDGSLSLPASPMSSNCILHERALGRRVGRLQLQRQYELRTSARRRFTLFLIEFFRWRASSCKPDIQPMFSFFLGISRVVAPCRAMKIESGYNVGMLPPVIFTRLDYDPFKSNSVIRCLRCVPKMRHFLPSLLLQTAAFVVETPWRGSIKINSAPLIFI